MRDPKNTGEHSGTNKKTPTFTNTINYTMGELENHRFSEVLHLSSYKADYRGGLD